MNNHQTTTDNHLPELWFFISGKPYQGKEPDFFETHSFNWVKFLEENYETIYNELKNYLKKNETTDYKPYFNSNLVNNKNSWETIPVMVWGIQYTRLKNFKTLKKLIQTFPEVVSLSFNKLNPGGKILPHQGDTNGIYRAHLGLQITEKLPSVGFRVNSTKKSWENGKVFVFCDAFEHEAWNNSTTERIILSIDVIRPEFINKKRTICLTVLIFLALQFIAGKFPLLQKTPRFLIAPLFLLIILILKPISVFFSILKKLRLKI
jgi:hypothetical protein